MYKNQYSADFSSLVFNRDTGSSYAPAVFINHRFIKLYFSTIPQSIPVEIPWQ
jgi:hypothetical protein